ncbi:MAG: sulfite exporter TauE/SafE family protein [Thiotrichaceae bacterium]|nr:sulfite exporter TauE/SafE family protein [Thiotrichaceae bacterium]
MLDWANYSIYLTAFLAGLAGGVHCVGMCGGIVGILSLSTSDAVTQTSNKFWILLGYNLGRIASYMLAGALVGGLGAGVLSLVELQQLKLILSIVAALFMLALGLYLTGIWQGLSYIEKIGSVIWPRIEPFSRQFIPSKNMRQSFSVGLIWGWLPCGLVYTLLIMALSSGSVLQGILVMLFFGLGTLPTLITVGLSTTILSAFISQPIVRLIAGIIVIVMALIMLIRAL